MKRNMSPQARSRFKIAGGVLAFIVITTLLASATSRKHIGAIDHPTLGRISGAYVYPSERIPPDIEVCAEDFYTQQFVGCTNSRINSDQFITGIGYEMYLPAGNYAVYAKKADGERAYYNGYIATYRSFNKWLDYDTEACTELYRKMVVSVETSRETVNVDAGDWHYKQNCGIDQL